METSSLELVFARTHRLRKLNLQPMVFEFRKKQRGGKVFKGVLAKIKASSLTDAKEKFLKHRAVNKLNTKIHVVEIKRVE